RDAAFPGRASAMKLSRFAAISMCALCWFAAAPTFASTPPFGAWQRLSKKPILTPQGSAFESAGVFNPAVIQADGQFVMLYRAQDKAGTSRLGYASSTDGIHFRRRPAAVLAPEA